MTPNEHYNAIKSTLDAFFDADSAHDDAIASGDGAAVRKALLEVIEAMVAHAKAIAAFGESIE